MIAPSFLSHLLPSQHLRTTPTPPPPPPPTTVANMPLPKPFHLLEINIISAQNLETMSKKMHTYATAWVHPKRKLSTRIDTQGHANPTWNDKFVFRVDDDFLRSDASTVVVEVYAVQWFCNTLVGTVRVLVSNLIPPPSLTRRRRHYLGTRFVALQVRRPSGRPQGILNIGVGVLNSSMRSMPMYNELGPPYHDQMDGEYSNHYYSSNNNPLKERLLLRRSRSETSGHLTGNSISISILNSSLVVVPEKKISISEENGEIGKANSAINGAELNQPPKFKAQKGKPRSMLSFSSRGLHRVQNQNSTAATSFNEASTISKFNGHESIESKGSGKFIFRGLQKHGSMLSDLEVGPSPSEVAAAVATRNRYPLGEERRSELSVEGLRSKLNRWRMELPPLYDQRLPSSSRRSSHSTWRQTGGKNGLFSCFGNIYGYECQCICGKPAGRKFLIGSSSNDTASQIFF